MRTRAATVNKFDTATGERFLDGRVALYHGDSREVLRCIPDASIDSVVTDPPYALVSIVKRFGSANAAPARGNEAYARASAGFMGQTWDTGETAFASEFWAEVMRVLKPGGYVVAASGTRTYHRLAVAIEDAGFEIRDMVSWLYGSGFPKSMNVAKAIESGGGRPEDIRKMQLGGSYRPSGRGRKDQDFKAGPETTVKWSPATDAARQWEGWGTALKPACEPWVLARKPLVGTVAANVQKHGVGALNIDGARIAAESGDYDHPGNNRTGTPGDIWAETGYPNTSQKPPNALGRWPANVIHDGSEEAVANFPIEEAGSASRYFYSPKADADDRLGSRHPTVKPVDLMQYLVRLITPKGGVTLDPFAGTGTTGEAAWREGMSAILIEREAAYANDIRRRLTLAASGPDERKRESLKANGKAQAHDDLPLFGGE